MENNPAQEKIGVVIMTYGSATTADHVAEYFEHIYPSKTSQELIDDFKERYRLVGHSPLIDITKEQARLLEEKLNTMPSATGDRYVVRAGMQHSDPFIDEAVRECKEAGATRCVGIVLSPQFSSIIMAGYTSALTAAAKKYGFADNEISIIGPWPTEKHFIALLSERVKTAMAELQKQYGKNIPVAFTTHSLPKRVVDKDPQYLDQLKSTTDAVLAELNDPKLEYYIGYQSAGHTPEEWLKPDLMDILAALRDKKSPAILIVPIQFLADHLEILYDLDIAGKKQCDDYGIAYHRIELPNTDPLFIEALAGLLGS